VQLLGEGARVAPAQRRRALGEQPLDQRGSARIGVSAAEQRGQLAEFRPDARDGRPA
jgi:hypothetical protein